MSLDNTARVFMGGLPIAVHKHEIKNFFQGYGNIKYIAVKRKYAFVQFEHYKDADRAVSELADTFFLDRKVTVEKACGINRGHLYSNENLLRAKYQVIIKNLSSRVSWSYLKRRMRQFGWVACIDINNKRREATVNYCDSSDMRAAIRELNDTTLCGRRIQLVQALRTDSRSNSRSYSSNSRSKSRNRSRSRSSRRAHRSCSKSPYLKPQNCASTSRSNSSSERGSKSKIPHLHTNSGIPGNGSISYTPSLTK